VNPVLKWMLITFGALAGIVALMAIVGAFLPKKHTASRSITLNASPDSVFAIIADVERYAEWRGDVKEVTLLATSDGTTRFREMGKDGAVTYRVMERVPPLRYVVRIDDATLPYGGSWISTLRPEGSGTVLTITEDGEVYNPIFRFLSRTVFSPSATIEKYQASLRDRVESR